MDLSSFNSLLETLKAPFKNFTNIFNKHFIKQRRHLHFIISAIIIFLFFDLGQDIQDLQIQYFPFWVVLLFGWFGGYGMNFAREWYYAVKGAALFDWLDIYAGCYGGLLGSIIYLLTIA